MPEALRVILVEDSEDDADMVLRHLRQGGFAPEHRRVQTGPDLRASLDGGDWDLVISDFSMPGFDGNAAYATLLESRKDIPFIFVSGTLGEDAAVEAMRLGVSDYFVKGNLKRLLPAIRRELKKMDERRRYQRTETALREAGQQLRRSQKMEAIGRLAAGVAHDFNSLITVIMGTTGEMLKDLDQSDQRWGGMKQVQACSERAAVLTRQLLQFGSREAGRRKAVDLNSFLRGNLPLLKWVAGSEIELDCRIPDSPAWILADEDQLTQILMNLCFNARDAMKGKGVLAVSAAHADLGEQDVASVPQLRPGPHAVLTVQDDGEGMSPETLAHVFEPFFTTKDPDQGTGLGLAIVYGAVEQNEGHIRVRSRAGEGSIFEAIFPSIADRGSNAFIAPVPEPQPRRGVETVLVVEDEETLREYMRLVLSRRGFNVLAAGTGEQALVLGRLYPGTVHLLIADLKLGGGIDGRAVAESFLAEKRAGTPVLFMTGYAEEGLNGQLAKDGVDLLMKPFTGEELVKAIRRTLEAVPEPGAGRGGPFA